MRVRLCIRGAILLLVLFVIGCESDRIVASIDDSDPAAIVDTDSDSDTDTDSDSDTTTGNEDFSCQDLAEDNRDYSIHNDSGLDDISVFTVIYGDLNLTSSSVTELHKLECLRRVTGNLTIQGTALQDFDGLSSLELVDGTFYVMDNYALETFSGLERLDLVGGLSIINNNELVTIDHLGTLQSVDGFVSIDHNYSLATLDGLENIQEVEELSISYNHNLATLSGLNSLEKVHGDFLLGYNPHLQKLFGLSSLQAVYGDFKIYDNYSIIDLVGLENFTEVFDLSICGNVALETMTGLEGVVSVQGDLKIGCANYLYYDAANGITDMTGLENLESVHGFFLIMINDYMTDLSGLEKLVSVGDYLWIWYNIQLESLDGLNGLRSIGNDLVLEQNYSLNNLYALCDLEMVMDLHYHNNASLDECEAYALIERLSNFHGWWGDVYVSPADYMSGDLSYCEEWVCNTE